MASIKDKKFELENVKTVYRSRVYNKVLRGQHNELDFISMLNLAYLMKHGLHIRYVANDGKKHRYHFHYKEVKEIMSDAHEAVEAADLSAAMQAMQALAS